MDSKYIIPFENIEEWLEKHKIYKQKFEEFMCLRTCLIDDDKKYYYTRISKDNNGNDQYE